MEECILRKNICVLSLLLICLFALSLLGTSPMHAAPASAQLLAFAKSGDDGMRSDIYVSNSDGSGQVNLTHAPKYELDIYPNWSPDGKQLAYAFSSSEFMGCRIMVMNVDGSQKTNLTGASAQCNTDPVWSPDGKHIAYMQYPMSGGYDDQAVWVMNADGTQQQELSDIVTQAGLMWIDKDTVQTAYRRNTRFAMEFNIVTGSSSIHVWTPVVPKAVNYKSDKPTLYPIWNQTSTLAVVVELHVASGTKDTYTSSDLVIVDAKGGVLGKINDADTPVWQPIS